MRVAILCFGVKHSFTHSLNFFHVFGGSVSVGWCAFCFWSTTRSFNNCFWKIRVALIRAGWCDLTQADLLTWADSAGWTGSEVLTALDEWKMALVMVLV